MKINRKKNGYKITVKDWSSEVVLTEIATNKVVAVKTFTDHIQAVLVAKAL